MALQLLFCRVLSPGFVQIARRILSQFPSTFFSKDFIRVHVVQPYSSIDTATDYKNSCFILSYISDFHKIDNLSIAVLASPMCMLTSLSIDEILLPKYEVNTMFPDFFRMGTFIDSTQMKL